MRAVKDEVRVLGVDDAPFEFSDDTTALIGTVFRGGDYIEAVLRDDIVVDGEDVTGTVIDLVREGRHREQVQAVLLDGITFAGFNVADIGKIAAEADVAVLAVSREMPDRDRMQAAMNNVDDAEQRMRLVERAGEPVVHEQPEGRVHFQCAGVEEEQAHELLDVTTRRGLLPEPIRVAHLIAAALEHGESRGRA